MSIILILTFLKLNCYWQRSMEVEWNIVAADGQAGDKLMLRSGRNAIFAI